jgi:hypothetical protein
LVQKLSWLPIWRPDDCTYGASHCWMIPRYAARWDRRAQRSRPLAPLCGAWLTEWSQ